MGYPSVRYKVSDVLRYAKNLKVGDRVEFELRHFDEKIGKERIHKKPGRIIAKYPNHALVEYQGKRCAFRKSVQYAELMIMANGGYERG